MENQTTLKYGGYPMKWYKWQIYFLLFATALACLGNGLMYLTGGMYRQTGYTAEMIYGLYPAMKTPDMFAGFLYLVQMVIALMARWKLAGLKADGPTYLYVSYAMSVVTEVVYAMMVAGAMNVSLTAVVNVGSLLGSVIGTGLMIWLNRIYFTKRKVLFVN